MNQIAAPLRGLYWKDVRQLLPLVCMLVGMAVFLVVLWSMADITSRFGSIIGDYIPLTIPALYAAGVGALLVGQEKETRTLLWCSSLPIAPSQIAMVKYVVAVIGLIVTWVSSLVIGEFAGIVGPASSSWVPTPGQLGPANVLYWFLHSVFVLFCGFYTAWRFKNTFASLIAIIPIAALPYLATQSMYTLITSGSYISLEESAGVLSVTTLIGIAVFAVLGYRAALQHLSPAEADQDSSSSMKWLAAWRPATSVPIPDEPFRFSLSSLVWQSIHHNRPALLLFVVLMLFGTVCLVLTTENQLMNRYDGTLGVVVVAGLLAVSWLGVFAFNGDGSASRMRFLADRGVSPTLAWLGRQLIGLSLVALVTLLYAATSYWFLYSDLVNGNENPNAISMLTFGFILMTVYSVSQWTSQLIRILAASAFAAPALSLAAGAWLVMAVENLDAPWWTLLLCVAIPLIATWVMMRRFMDNHVRWPLWVTGLGVAGLFYVLPTLPFAIETLNWPSISKELRTELMAEALRIPAPATTPQTISWGVASLHETSDLSTLSVDEALARLERRDDSPQSTISIGDMSIESKTPLTFDYYVFWQGLQAAEYARAKLESDLESTESLELLGEWIRTYAVIAKRLRLSDRWYDQEAADTAEIWLTAILSDPQMSKHLERDFARVAIDVIADHETRNASRRRAVLASWRNYNSRSHSPKDIEDRYLFGGFDTGNWFAWHKDAKRNAILDRSLDTLVATTIRYIESGSSGEDSQAIRRELHALFAPPEIPFEAGPYADERRATGSADHPTYYHKNFEQPATQWFAAWEAAATQLKTNQSRGK